MQWSIRWIKRVYFRVWVRWGIKVLETLDDRMKYAGYNRTYRRQFWREFTAKQVNRDFVLTVLIKKGGGKV